MLDSFCGGYELFYSGDDVASFSQKCKEKCELYLSNCTHQLLNMPEAINSREIIHELRAIRDDLEFIKNHMVDVDSIMTEDDYLSLNEFGAEKKIGKLTSHEELKREMGL